MFLAAQALETGISATPAPGAELRVFTLELAGVAPGIQAPQRQHQRQEWLAASRICLLQTAAYPRAGQLKIRAQLLNNFLGSTQNNKKTFFEGFRYPAGSY